MRLFICCLLAFAASGWLAAGPDEPEAKPVDIHLARYELGRRMKAFETAWEKTKDPAAKLRSAKKLEEVHSRFLTLRFTEAARTLDQAAYALQSENDPGSIRQWVMSLIAIPDRRIVDGNARQLTITVQPLYPVKGNPPRNLEVQLWFTDKQIHRSRPTEFPYVAKVPLPPLGDFRGLDRKLYFMVEAGKVLNVAPVGISQVADLDSRLESLKKLASTWPAIDTIEKATVSSRLEQLEEMRKGTTQEIDVPAASLLENSETMARKNPFFSWNHPGQYWLSVPLSAGKRTPVRISIPPGLDAAKPVPVVVGLHGAGGSENLFFAGYGAGQGVREAESRGWIFVTTRSGFDFTSAPPVTEILDVLAKRYPIDRKRVFLIGHSMGAGQVVRLAEKHPGKFAALAALGGGGEIKNRGPFADLPVFVAAGEKDFARGYARKLSEDLVAGGAKDASYREYRGADHLLIVREALPDVFKMFDRVESK